MVSITKMLASLTKMLASVTNMLVSITKMLVSITKMLPPLLGNSHFAGHKHTSLGVYSAKRPSVHGLKMVTAYN